MNRGKRRTADDYPSGDDLAMPTVGQPPPPRDHVAPQAPVDGRRRDFSPFGGPLEGTVGSYLKLAAEHAGKCDTALECAIDVAAKDASLVLLVPILAQLRLDAGKLERLIRNKRATNE